MRFLSLHSLLHGALAYALAQQWGTWQVGVGIALAHGWIDLIKSRCGSGPKEFALDQLAHGIWLLLMAKMMNLEAYTPDFIGARTMVVTAGAVSAIWGAGYFIRTVADQLSERNPKLKESLDRGLKNGGAQIGKLERALIFLLVFLGQPGGVGFLVAAKSIIRFQEAKEQHLAEYVLIGTLWSFGLALAFASLTRSLVAW